MIRALILVACLLPIGLLTPVLEIGPTHVFNPNWPGHARLHEVWQLITNCLLVGLCLWLAYRRGDLRLASLIGMAMCTGFLAAAGLGDQYGGTMRHSDGSELAVGGVNVAVAVMALALIGFVWLFVSSLGKFGPDRRSPPDLRPKR